MKKYLLVLTIFMFSLSVLGQTYYLDAINGSDSSGDGTEANPYQTLNHVSSLLSGGETVILKPGTYSEFTNLGGNKSSWINITGQGDLDAIIEGVRLSGGTQMQNIYLNFSNIDFSEHVFIALSRYFKLNNCGVKDGVETVSSEYVEIDNCIIEKHQPWIGSNEAIDQEAVCFRRGANISVTNTEITRCQTAIVMYSDNVYIGHNHIHDIVHDGIRIIGTRHGVIEYNRIHGADDGVEDSVEVSPGVWERITWSRHCDGLHFYIQGGTCGTQVPNYDITVRGNIIYDISAQAVQFNGLPSCPDINNSKIIFEDNIWGPVKASYIMNMGAPTDSVIFRNNTFVYFPEGRTYTGYYRTIDLPNYDFWLAPANEQYIYNNIMVDAPTNEGYTVFDYNVYRSNTQSVALGRFSSVDASLAYSNPGAFDGVLESNASILNAGTNNDFSFPGVAFDVNEQPRDAHFDIGAYEVPGQNPPPEPPLPTPGTEETVFFLDDFSDGNLHLDPWLYDYETQGLSWYTVGNDDFNVLQRSSLDTNVLYPPLLSGTYMIIADQGSDWDAYTLSFDACNISQAYGAGPMILFKDVSNYYFIDIGSNMGTLYRVINGISTQLMNDALLQMPVAGTATYNVGIQVTGNSIIINANGISYVDTDATALSTFTSGGIGFLKDYDINYYNMFYDNISVELGIPEDVAVSEVAISPASLSLVLNQTAQLQAVISPENATNKFVTWVSSNTSVATIDAFGNITTVSPGNTTITVTTVDGNKTATCSLTVTEHAGGSSTNLALGKPVAESAYQNDPPNFVYPGSNLVDGITTDDSRWSAYSYPQWVEIDLQDDYDLTAIDVFTMGGRAYQYYVEAKQDGGTYTTIVDRTSNTQGTPPISDLVSINARYVKLTVTGASGYTGSWISINEIMVFGNQSGSSVPVENVILSPSSLILFAGQTYDLNETIIPSNATDQTVVWSSDNSAVATVDANGFVTAISTGSASITVTSNDGGYTANCIVSVTTQTTSLQIPADTDDQKVRSNSTLEWYGQPTATVGKDAAGILSVWVIPFELPALQSGESVISAQLDVVLSDILNDPNGHVDLYALPYRTASDVSLSDYFLGAFGTDPSNTPICDDYVTLSSVPGTISTNTSASENIAAYINAQYASGAQAGDFIFLRLNLDEEVTYTSRGWKFHTANAVDPANRPLLTLEVSTAGSTTPVINVSVLAELVLDAGQTFDLDETVWPVDATDKSVSWASSNTAVATVDANGVVSAVSEGSATITVTTTDGGFTDNCIVTVTEPVTGVSLSQSTLDIETGQTYDLDETIVPANATDQSVSWASSNTAVATVDANGLVTAISAGSATITVTTNDNGFTANCSVAVTSPSIILSIPADADDQKVRSNNTMEWVGQPTAAVGKDAAGSLSVWVIPFELPSLQSGESVISAQLDVVLNTITTLKPNGHVDLYALPYRTASDVSLSDYFLGVFGTDPSNAPIQDDFVTLSSTPGIQSTNAAASDNIAAYINAQYAAGAQAGDFIFFRLNLDEEVVNNSRGWNFHTANAADPLNRPVLELEIGTNPSKSTRQFKSSIQKDEAFVEIWPNPVAQNSELIIDLSGFNQSNKLQLKIFDIAGKNIYSRKDIHINTDGTGQLVIPVNKLMQNGTYFMSIGNSYQVAQKMLIVK